MPSCMIAIEKAFFSRNEQLYGDGDYDVDKNTSFLNNCIAKLTNVASLCCCEIKMIILFDFCSSLSRFLPR